MCFNIIISSISSFFEDNTKSIKKNNMTQYTKYIMIWYAYVSFFEHQISSKQIFTFLHLHIEQQLSKTPSVNVWVELFFPYSGNELVTIFVISTPICGSFRTLRWVVHDCRRRCWMYAFWNVATLPLPSGRRSSRCSKVWSTGDEWWLNVWISLSRRCSDIIRD